jgi:hypothetical protein
VALIEETGSFLWTGRDRPLRNVRTVNNDKPSNDHDKNSDVHEKMQKRLSDVVFIR